MAFRNAVITYFGGESPVRDDVAKAAHLDPRRDINRLIERVKVIVSACGVGMVYRYSPPRTRGGLISDIDIISNVFQLQQLRMGPDGVVDCVDRALGVLEEGQRSSWLRTFNPLFWAGRAVEVIVGAPFALLGRLGFDRPRIEGSLPGRLVKVVLSFVTFLAALLTVLELLGILQPIRERLFGNGSA